MSASSARRREDQYICFAPAGAGSACKPGPDSTGTSGGAGAREARSTPAAARGDTQRILARIQQSCATSNSTSPRGTRCGSSLCRHLLGVLLCVIGAQADAAANYIPALIEIPAGIFTVGSDAIERELAYRLDELAYHEPITREQGWYAGELLRRTVHSEAYCITATPITNRQYAAFIAPTRHRAPRVDRKTWASYQLIHPFESTRRFAWKDRKLPQGREDHPVVLVSLADAQDYAAWLTRQTDSPWRLPTEHEWEKAMRGTDGRYFPWGNEFSANNLNSADTGPFDTTPAGQYASGSSPFGVLDGAGQVYEWTATPQGAERSIVKGGSWDDKGCGVCRAAARHSRPNTLKHILIGFRLVRNISPDTLHKRCQ